jgi:hypothetical protein
VFGVPSGPYAGKARTVTFARLPEACKRRFTDSLAGKGALSPIFRPGPTRRSLRVLAAVLLFLGLYGLFAARWPSVQGAIFALYDLCVATLLVWTIRGARRTLAFDGTVIPAGTYLFPLDVVEARADGLLVITPLGQVREAAVATVASRPSLLLTFQDGTSRAFGADSPNAVEVAFAALENAQKTLEKLTYDHDLSAAVHMDPFFEVRMDGTWETAAPHGARQNRASTLLTLALGALLGLSVFGARTVIGLRAAHISQEHRREQERDREEQLAQRVRETPTKDVPHKSDAMLRQDEREGREAQRRKALRSLQDRARSPEVADAVAQLVERARANGANVKVYFAHTCEGLPACRTYDADLARYEDRTARTFQAVFSETIPRNVLAFDLERGRPEPDDAVLAIDYVVAAAPVTGTGPMVGADGGSPALLVRFDVRLRVPGVAPSADAGALAFLLTMPPPRTSLTRLREHSIFARAASDAPESLVFARDFDRLYDELYGLFLAGPPRVPLRDDVEESDANERLKDTFGVH